MDCCYNAWEEWKKSRKKKEATIPTRLFNGITNKKAHQFDWKT